MMSTQQDLVYIGELIASKFDSGDQGLIASKFDSGDQGRTLGDHQTRFK